MKKTRIGFAIGVLLVVMIAGCATPAPPAPAAAPIPTPLNQGSPPTPQPSNAQSSQSSSSKDKISKWALDFIKTECTKWYSEEVYDFKVTNLAQGNITDKMRNTDGVQELWCITSTAKCGNRPTTDNHIYTKIKGKWQGTYSDPDFWSDWEAAGCPFSMSR